MECCSHRAPSLSLLSSPFSSRLMMSPTLPPSAARSFSSSQISPPFLSEAACQPQIGTGCASFSMVTRGHSFLPWAMIQSQHSGWAPLQRDSRKAAGSSGPTVITGI